MRSWAVDVVDQFSGVRFPIKAKADLIERVSLPVQHGPQGYRSLARRFKADKRFKDAVQAYMAAFELEPSDAEPLNFAAVILSRDLEDYDAAEDMYNRALEVDHEYVSPIYNKACNEVRRQNHTRALDYLEEAISKDSKYRQFARRDKVFDSIIGNEERRRLESLIQ
jgi:tetratricopeptide (TPR) repeat protein